MSIGARRHRVTLMAEQMIKGAGGRLTRNRPIIADIWAEVSESATTSGSDSGVTLVEKASITAPYSSAYRNARFLEWDGRLFRVESYRLSGTITRLISFDASRLQG